MTDLTGPRASSLAYGCPRQTFYQAIDAPARPTTDREERLFRRGHAVSNAIRDEIIAELRADGQRPRREEPIPWPAGDPVGVGHADLWVSRHRRIVEVTSTAGAELDPHKARQAALYAMEHPLAEEAYVLSIDPSTWWERWWPINVEGLAPELRELEAELVAGIRSNAPPARRCQRRSDAEQYRCRHVDVCFGDEPDPFVDVVLDPRVVALVEQLAAAEEQHAAAKTDESTWSGVVKSLRAELAEVIPANETLEVGGYRVRRSTWTQDDFSLAKCVAAGFELPDELAPFRSTSDRQRWTLKELRS